MSRSKKYADKTLSLMKQKCSKKTNKLVYTDYPKIPRGHCKPVYVPKISKSCGTRIRYCTAKELKLMAGPRFCECPSKSERVGFLKSIARNAIKAATLFGVTYLTYDLGFWGVPRDTENTFAGVCEAMPCKVDPCKSYQFSTRSRECEEELDLLQVTPQDPCSCENPIPIDMEKCIYKMKQVWNHTVILVFEGIANAPDNLIDYVSKKWNELMKKDCKVCYPNTTESFDYSTDKCELVDDYEERYEGEEQEEDECKIFREEAKAFMEEAEE